ncbi:MAG: 4-hydroxy-tetrahydrodipicolinate reductase [Bacteroidales bacterium]
MNIGLIGYGKMGKEIEAIALERGHTITKKFDIVTGEPLTIEALKQCQVAIEFTSPETATENIKTCFDAGVPVVCGSTGWNHKEKEMIELCQKQNQTLFFSSNFSLGVNLFFEFNKHIAKLMNKYPDYNLNITEIHHTQKKDAPSGTAITLAEKILENYTLKKEWTMNTPPQDTQLHITAIREGEVPGTHIVEYSGQADKIIFTHEAKNRKGFALGAVLAAEFIFNKKGVFGMKDLLHLNY